ncbi:MAG: UMP kinase [Chlamydiota bacterium]|nr:UMP kinase [Chlamydiota bacterium]
MNKKNPYRRILLKISGETIMGSKEFGIDPEATHRTAEAIKKIHEQGMEVAIVIGGGNIFRGIRLSEAGMKRTPADNMGMLATIINGTALQQGLQAIGCDARVMSGLECPKVAESYNWRLANEYLSSGEIVIFVGGTGSPYFTTDTAAALRANEIHADILLKATKVDGVYDKDPMVYTDAVKYETIGYTQALNEQLKVMDAAAFALCMDNSIPIFVFNMEHLFEGSLSEILITKKHGTLVGESP